jgi:thymidylate kinase
MLYCGLDSYNQCCFFEKYLSIGTEYLIIIEGCQRSGKTTLAKYISKSLEIGHMRGYLMSNDLLNVKFQSEACYQSKQIIETGNFTNLKGVVFDRSPISSIAYLSRMVNDIDSFYKCCAKFIEYFSNKKTKVIILFIICDIEFILAREDTQSVWSIKDEETISKEISIYNSILEFLLSYSAQYDIKNVAIDSIINNSNSINCLYSVGMKKINEIIKNGRRN